MKTRVHINLTTSDLAKSVEFYTTLFGTAPTKRQFDYANWRLENPALHLALVHVPNSNVADADARHFGIELFDDRELAGWKDRVQRAGLQVRTEDQVTCCYAVADKFWAADPDGNEWEFWVRHEEADKMHDEPQGCCGATAQENKQAQSSGSCCAAGASATPGLTLKQEQPGQSSCCG